MEVPADLFKQAPASFQRRIHLLVNEILIGDHDCDKELLMAKVILIHKDNDITILDHYRPIALLNTIHQLIMIIITSRLRQLSGNSRGHGRLPIWLPNTPRSTNGGPEGSMGTAAGNEREWHFDLTRSGL